MSNETLKAKVKKTGEIIRVYKLKDGRYHIFQGEKLSLEKIYKGEHVQIFNESELEFIHI